MKTNKKANNLCKELGEKIGKNKVKDDEAILVTYASDYSLAPFSKPGLVILPESTQDVKEVLVVANREKVPVTVMSAGVNIGGLTVPSDGGIVLDFRNMDRILEINTDSNYAVIEPGVIFDRFTAALNEKGFRCHLPTAPGGATPLGNYLLNPSGSLSNRHLDSIIDLEVVIPDGTILNTGSAAFPSDASKPNRRYGPFSDVAGLFCCGYGTLGVVTRASVRIYPKNESNRVNLTAFEDFGSAVRFVQDVVGNNIPESCIIWSWQFYKTYDISFPSFANPSIPAELFNDPRKPPEGIPYTVVTTFMSGYEEMMITAEKICKRIAEKYGGRAISMDEMETICPGAVPAWKQFYSEHHQPKMEHNKKYGLGQYVSLLLDAAPDDVIEIEKWALKEMLSFGATPVCYYAQPFDFGRYMMFRTFAYYDPEKEDLLKDISEKVKGLYQVAMSRYGATPERYKPKTPVMLQQLGGYYHLLKLIKNAIDPNNILNPQLELFKEE